MVIAPEFSAALGSTGASAAVVTTNVSVVGDFAVV